MPEHRKQREPLDTEWLSAAVARALDEDLGGDPGRDVTTQSTIAATTQVEGSLVMREAGVVAGTAVAREVLTQVAKRLDLPVPRLNILVHDGDVVPAATAVAHFEGAGHVVLIAERTLLNFMSRACGVATHTRRWVDALADTGAKVLDTRKTTPGLRELEKYAVRCGGGINKRMGLFDCAMVKDNHIVATGSVSAAFDAIQEAFPRTPIQVEVESWEQAHEALAAGATFLMLDNMDRHQMASVVASVRALEHDIGKVWLEATGGLTLENAADVARTGVDYMSVGALTHSSPIIDLALDLS
ncbi:carboxylating nicotinate-nucleotide diphosphorylase [Demequina aurantiaca]|uniref:carboxylating nicotinate-nucleotide diphosphorylase n=1 Tax=Demequina aurantiaca TaxID=676200 RepID=UPI000784B00B|nr:carboxylating nicotinate-nucleotide diphosphorylase [Demequina aurantiaca]